MNFSKLSQSFKMSIKSIMGNKGRSALTMLGIIIGVASVIILTGIGEGATSTINDSLAEMGTKLITVSMSRGGWGGSTRTVSIDSMQEFLDENPDLVEAMSPSMSGNVLLKVGNENTYTSLTAYDSTYADIKDPKIQSGRFISEFDITHRSYVCIVGTYIVQEYFGGMDPVGETIKLNGRQFKVVGVYEEKGNSTETSQDNAVTIPYTTAMRFLKNKNITTYYFSAATEESVEAAVNSLESYITNKLGTDTGFTVSSVAEIMDTLDEITGTMTTMLAGIAAISLVVGGIGIMNIMTVSVSERTREIGIRKAIGARTTDILTQFLVESTIISAMGGVVGIVFGVGVGQLVCTLISMQFVTKPSMVMLSFFFSLFIGIFFGIAPAKKAAKLHPIDALRSE
ncbi:MAG: ABC transporter permease [Clostridia bacterium]|nr:ABC transporter permease [Clostridia bacterium]MBP3360097.1 ABC transporter permease [Clostridia bacterium]